MSFPCKHLDVTEIKTPRILHQGSWQLTLRQNEGLSEFMKNNMNTGGENLSGFGLILADSHLKLSWRQSQCSKTTPNKMEGISESLNLICTVSFVASANICHYQ